MLKDYSWTYQAIDALEGGGDEQAGRVVDGIARAHRPHQPDEAANRSKYSRSEGKLSQAALRGTGSAASNKQRGSPDAEHHAEHADVERHLPVRAREQAHERAVPLAARGRVQAPLGRET